MNYAVGTDKFKNITVDKYENLINVLKSGDIFFCSGNYLVSELIKKVSGSMFSHTGIIIKWGEHTLVMESVEDDGVRMVPLEHYINNYENSNKRYNGSLYVARHKLLENLNNEDEMIRNLIKIGLSLLNRSYDKNEIARIVARIGLGIGRHEDNEEYICSEFVNECFKKIGIEVLTDSEGYIFPEHIAIDQHVYPIAQIE
ncbi:YiiX/YebB-like N1pC/P60 family cysteine hydrolase [Bacillus songklensis]|uniref:YiiX/YebB-like N1pC/P60 family cysteine hydrolase n=1 Tax=Bacillus songklensis TaxID=1069116 RepID=A0ABV8BAE8_9BACI